MKIFVEVKAGRKEQGIKKIDENHFAVSVKARAQEGQANIAVIKIIAEHFRVPKSAVKIVSGQSSRTKVLQIL